MAEVDPAAIGGGDFTMDAAVIETATWVVGSNPVVGFADGEDSVVSQNQSDHRGDTCGMPFSSLHFMTVARSLGMNACRPEIQGELAEAVERTIGGAMTLGEIPVQSVAGGE